MSDDEQNLHDDLTDQIVLDFLKDTEDISLVIEIDWVDDLGIRVIMSSDGDRSFARSGSPDSVTDALNKLVAKAVPRIKEHREYRAKIEAAYASAEDDDEED